MAGWCAYSILGFSAVKAADFRGAACKSGTKNRLSVTWKLIFRPAVGDAHGHDKNPGFKKVVLHVLWSVPKKETAILPVLALGKQPDAFLTELVALENKVGLPEPLRGKVPLLCESSPSCNRSLC